MFGSIELSGNDWLVPVVALLVLALMILTWGYRSALLTKKIRFISFTLKTVGLLLLTLCLLEPVWVESRARPGSNLFLIVADNGEGLNIRDRKSTETRGEILKKILTGPGSEWQKDLEDDFQVRRYLFDTRLRLTKNFSDLDFTGKLSEMSGALRRIQERYDGQPLAGILLLTDGIATDWDSSSLDLENLPPVYPVPIGVGFPDKDISVSNVSVTQTAFEDAPVTINAEVEVIGFSGRSVEAELLDSEGGVVKNQSISVTEDQQKLAFRFRIHPEKPGVSFYRFRVYAVADSGEADIESAAHDKEEATLANNQSHIVVERPVEPFRMLYVAGRPNWDYKFLNRAVQGDSQLTMAALIRIAKKAPRFQYLGREGEQSNPLYRGFGEKDDEEKEDHDQAVMKRLNVKDAFELRDGFPKSREVLYEYDAVILDDLESAFFSANQMDLIRRFVSERGGGFLMMGGQESFRQGKYANTPIEDLLPVYLSPPDSLTPADDLGLQLTREGWVQPWARLRANETDEEERFKQMPHFKVMNKVERIKPGASVIVEAVDPYLQVYPALITQRYGRGKSAALTIGDMYRWGLGKKKQTEDRSKAWRQLLRWLVVEVPQRVEIELEPDTDLNGFAKRIEVRVRNKAFEPMDEASIQLEVLREGEEAILLPVEPSNKEPGLFVASFVPRETAGYSVRVKALDNQNELIGQDEAGWSNDFAAEEFKSLNPNLPLLQDLAEKTQGEVVRAKDISQFIRTLSKKDAPITEQFRTPLWHSPIIFLLALVCFITEWGLRRWNRMP